MAVVLAALAACSNENAGRSSDPEVTLRLRPEPGAAYREHWIYDVEVPGSGVLRTGLSFDVAVSRADRGSALHYTLRRQYRGRSGQQQPMPRVIGLTVSSLWDSERSLHGDWTLPEGVRPELASLMRSLLAAARFGLLIEYPEQAVSVGESWSIEPRSVPVGPALDATLRPTYTLESIEMVAGERLAVIGADIQGDLARTSLAEGLDEDGGGTASGTLKVRVRDGVLLEARTVLHFKQEISVQGSEVLGYREFSATAHMFTTNLSAQPSLEGEPIKAEPLDPDDERECATALQSAAQRVGRAATPTRQFVVAALRSDSLPRALAALPLREAGTSLVIGDDAKRVELESASIETKELTKTLRSWQVASEPVYVFVSADAPLERLRGVIAALPRGSQARLVVHDAADPAPLPKPQHWLEEQLRLIEATPTASEREQQLRALLVDHLALCEGARDALRAADSNYAELPGRIVHALAKCGCTTTSLDGLETTLSALLGSSRLRYVRLRGANGLDDRKLSASSSVAEALQLLAAKGR
jgi:hypothetical protein